MLTASWFQLAAWRAGVKQRDKTMIWDTIDSTIITPQSASADDLLAIGMRYCLGHGVEQSYIAAHKWFNIAALKGSEAAKTYRCELSHEMSASEIAEAQRLARTWLTVH